MVVAQFSVLIVLCLSYQCCSGHVVIDDFSISSARMTTSSSQQYETNNYSIDNVVGGQRDMSSYTITNAPTSQCEISTEVIDSSWKTISIGTCYGRTSIQYDGNDTDTNITLGLNINLKENNQNTFKLRLIATHDSEYNTEFGNLYIEVYSLNGINSTAMQRIKKEQTEYYFPFTYFPNNQLDFENIGAIIISLDVFPLSTILVDYFTVEEIDSQVLHPEEELNSSFYSFDNSTDISQTDDELEFLTVVFIAIFTPLIIFMIICFVLATVLFFYVKQSIQQDKIQYHNLSEDDDNSINSIIEEEDGEEMEIFIE